MFEFTQITEDPLSFLFFFLFSFCYEFYFIFYYELEFYLNQLKFYCRILMDDKL